MSAKPFLKWAGGKAWTLDQIAPMLPKPSEIKGYRQPFLGGGTPFWQLYSGVRPAVLSDSNTRLVDAYLAVQLYVEPLIVELKRLEPEYEANRYYQIRDAMNRREGTLVERAAHFIVINKWGFNGLWRVNRSGECNVPFGRTSSGKAPRLCEPDDLRACSRALKWVRLRCEPYHVTLADAREGEFCYCDPPYHPVSSTADFVGYTADGFGYGNGNGVSDHDRLILSLRSLSERNVQWALSQADVPATREAYLGWDVANVSARRGINCKSSKRGPVGELLVRPA